MDSFHSAKAISPLDGRYYKKVSALSDYFSDFSLVKTRLKVEVEYYIKLMQRLDHNHELSSNTIDRLRELYDQFSLEDYDKVSQIEAVVNHDVKSVELFLKDHVTELLSAEMAEFVHFGLTSQDVNDVAIPYLLGEATNSVMIPNIEELIEFLDEKILSFRDVSFIARTHGQPASPTTLGKEIGVFSYRLKSELDQLKGICLTGKFGGATGNFNAHILAYPDIDWDTFGTEFLAENFSLTRSRLTTQIDNYESLSRTFSSFGRIAGILQDLSQDMWMYLLLGLITLEVKPEEVGSSAMPHKVNPISFENAEGNLQVAIAMFEFLARKLLVSRLQRDLTDYTVKRNIGIPMGHLLLSLHSLSTGLPKIRPHAENIKEDLKKNFVVIAEGIQTVLRSEGVENSYDLVKDLVRGTSIDYCGVQKWINDLDVDLAVKQRLLDITPETYIGNAAEVK